MVTLQKGVASFLSNMLLEGQPHFGLVIRFTHARLQPSETTGSQAILTTPLNATMRATHSQPLIEKWGLNPEFGRVAFYATSKMVFSSFGVPQNTWSLRDPQNKLENNPK